MANVVYSDEAITNAVRESRSRTEVLRRLGARVTGGSANNIRKRILRLGLDTSHLVRRPGGYKKGDRKRHWTQILRARPNSDRRQSGAMLRRALMESGLQYKCSHCGGGDTWNGHRLVLEVDHINDDWTDDRRENLQLLCPNCHSQKPKPIRLSPAEAARRMAQRMTTFCAACGEVKKTTKSVLCRRCNSQRPKNRRNRPDKETLQRMLWEKPTVKIAKEFGVTDNAVAKWVKRYGLEKPPRGYWAKLYAGKEIAPVVQRYDS